MKSHDKGGRTYERDYPVKAGTETEAVAKVRAQVEAMGRTVSAASAKRVDAGGAGEFSQGSEDSETSDAEAASEGQSKGAKGTGASKANQVRAGSGGVPAAQAGGRWYSGLGRDGRIAKRLAALEKAGVSIQRSGRMTQAEADKDGSARIWLNPDSIGEGEEAEQVVDEEIEHHFDHVVLAARRRRGGR